MHAKPFRLPAPAWWLLIVGSLFQLSISLSNTFVSIFLFKVDRSFLAIAWYHLFIFAMLPVTFVMAAAVARRTSTAMSLRLGIALYALFFAVALMVGEQAAHMPELLGVLTGLAEGFYWLAFDVLSVEYTDREGHEPFFGLFGVLTSIANVIAPPVAGALISREDAYFGGLTGYHVVFGISFALFVVATLVSLRLKSARLARLRLLDGFRSLRERPWRRVVLGSAAYGVREGVFMFLLGLLFYIVTGSEMKLGEFLLLQGALSFLAFYAAGRWSGRFRWRLLLLGAFGIVAASFAFLWPITTVNLVVYGVLSAAAFPLFLVPLQGYVFDAMHTLADDDVPSITHIVVREWVENAGRVLGVLAYFVIGSFETLRHVGGLGWLAFALGFMPLITVGFIRPVESRIFGPRSRRQRFRLGDNEETHSSAKRRARPTP
ncbi:MFS transporter [Alicyclobacillus vulcanalis]|uniref:MFS transporter, YQGE family, putative transporter n=1 Tax=Alicyclobacillus vulcanalis TaxID=252246 RepID=A0A1N7LY13_9BACL|nr:MFS transporter [Alicyclobacillus vulcanalis]SIS78591.1 MFS transporter, YQGE family, putative transporter [Alicyclobacillus vulcanalis]